MKRILFFIGLVVFAGSLSAGNFIFNPKFDMTPWDTGWTKQAIGCGGFRGDSFRYCSSPRSCKIWSGEDITRNFIYQEVSKVVNCTCRVYYQYVLDAVCDSLGGGIWASTEVTILVRIDGVWRGEWAKSVHADSEQPHEHSEDTVWTKWEKVYGDTDVVSGVQFEASCNGFIPWPGLAYESAELWIDDVYISGGTEVEEEENKIANYRLQAYPNPFMRSIEFRVESSPVPTRNGSGELKDSRLEILDVSGRVVREIPINEIRWDGNDENGKALPGGIYFAKLSGREENSTLKLILMR